MNRISLLLLLYCLPLPCFALPGDSEQPIEVEADRLEVRDEDNRSIYQGNVRLVQGSLEITSDRLVIHFDDQRELVLMEMTGSPARFRQLDEDRREMIGEAQQINYTESESMLELLRNARFDHAGDTIEGERIRIDTERNSIEASGDSDEQRVKMLIQPRQD
ncbi:MAG: lipopolysaccharide transport periplasmic protein LptA [Gammaproteobacteria bacterium]|nr:lipopolysaccharide transport periplasmic protein LptA [Gammaproteobacteria bacterium]